MIKKIEWDKSELEIKDDEKILNFEDFYIKTKINDKDEIKETYILGNKIIDFTKYNIVELTFQKMPKNTYLETHNIDTDIYEYKADTLYLVSIMTVESLQSFKYTEKLNLLTFAFEKESTALLFLSVLEDLRFKLWLQNFVIDLDKE